MQQVSVLETNIGSSTTGNSSNTQVIFNDNGTLRGDGGLTYNSSTDALTAGSFNPTASAIPTNGIYLPSSKNIGIAVDGVNVLNIDGIASRVTTTGSATITGDLTVDTSTLKVASGSNQVGVGITTFTGTQSLQVLTGVRISDANPESLNCLNLAVTSTTSTIETRYGTPLIFGTNATECYRIAAGGTSTWSVGGSTAMTLNSTGLGVGISPVVNLDIASASTTQLRIQRSGQADVRVISDTGVGIVGTYSNHTLQIRTNGTAAIICDTAQNVGVGVTPSAFGGGRKAIQIASPAQVVSANLTMEIGSNWWNDGTNYKYTNTNTASLYSPSNGTHTWFIAPSGTAGNNITFTQAMTLDASGNLLVGTTSGTYHTFRKNLAVDAGNAVFEIQGTGGGTSSIYYSVSGYNANAAFAASKFGRDGVTLRSINAGGTVNASGADYAEYMVKCSDFVLAKGDVAGIDANGKLTNVFADAVSFVVKSTDPSYVGNDKWGVGLEGADLESARQLVDRIAFAGQVPVNVTGAKAGDYIVPVVNGTGIKGISVSKPTFDQYQLAVGKVIAIDADGRARIIVKVA